MCKYFIGNHNMQVKVAAEDMIVFKAVNLDLKNNMWRAIYRTEYKAPLNKEITAKGHYPDLATEHFLEIGGGVFHSCADLNTMKYRISHFGYPYIVKCVVPKGTKYLASKVPNDICSEKLVVTDVIIAGDGVHPPFIDNRMLRKAEASVYSKNNRTYIHIKDGSHEVHLSLRNLGCYDWSTAIEQCKNLGEVLPNIDDWDLVSKYRHQIDPLIEEHCGDPINASFWSLSEYSILYAWFYGGSFAALGRLDKSNFATCRPVLAL